MKVLRLSEAAVALVTLVALLCLIISDGTSIEQTRGFSRWQRTQAEQNSAQVSHRRTLLSLLPQGSVNENSENFRKSAAMAGNDVRAAQVFQNLVHKNAVHIAGIDTQQRVTPQTELHEQRKTFAASFMRDFPSRLARNEQFATVRQRALFGAHHAQSSQTKSAERSSFLLQTQRLPSMARIVEPQATLQDSPLSKIASGYIAIWRVSEELGRNAQHGSSTSDAYVCRVAPLAKQGNGRNLLPKWMERHSEILSKNCGYNLKNVAFKLRVEQQRGARNELLSLRFVSADANVNVDDVLMFDSNPHGVEHDNAQAAGDVVRTDYPREHMPHFATDIQATLIVLDLFVGNNVALKRAARVFTEQGSFTDAALISQVNALPIRPVLPVRQALAELPTISWVHGFVRLIRNAMIEKRILTPTERDMFGHHVNTKAVLFRSALSYGGNAYNPHLLLPNNIVFARNDLSRRFRRDLPSAVRSQSSVRQSQFDTVCTIKLLIINRAGNERVLVEPDRVASSVRQQLAQQKRPHAPRLVVQHAKFEGLAFHLQVALMQEADIVVAPHGAGNTNVVFMRANATLLEIMPFGYLGAGPFANLARAYGVNYVPVVAEPDDVGFRDCIARARASALGDAQRKKILQTWDDARAIWRSTSATQQQKDNAIDLHSAENDYARFCARHQMLDFSPRLVAEALRPALEFACTAI